MTAATSSTGEKGATETATKATKIKGNVRNGGRAKSRGGRGGRGGRGEREGRGGKSQALETKMERLTTTQDTSPGTKKQEQEVEVKIPEDVADKERNGKEGAKV